MTSLRSWVRKREHPLAAVVYKAAKRARTLQMPVVPFIHRALYDLRVAVLGTVRCLLQAAWYTPLFQARLERPAPGLLVFGGIPDVVGPLAIEMGAGSRISGQTTLTARAFGPDRSRLTIGSNVEIGWQTRIAVGRRVVIGDNVLIAGRCYLAGYQACPDRGARADDHIGDGDHDIGDIVLEDDVWLASGVVVMAGVRIGRGTVVGAGSVVTHDLPAGVLAAGYPARVQRLLENAAGPRPVDLSHVG